MVLFRGVTGLFRAHRVAFSMTAHPLSLLAGAPRPAAKLRSRSPSPAGV